MGVGATNVSLERGGASGVPDARALCLGSEKGGMHIESTTYKRCTHKLDLLWPAVTAGKLRLCRPVFQLAGMGATNV